MKLNFRKIASVLSSAVMVSSTVALAAAASYPAPFISSGASDVAVVWGSTATLDTAAVNNLVASLNSRVTSGTSTVSTVTGESFTLQKTSDKFNLGENLNDIYPTLRGSEEDDELPGILADGEYEVDDTEYSQTITLGDHVLSHFTDKDYNDEKPVIGFDFANGDDILNYTLEFDSPVAIEADTDLVILGKKYYIAANDSDSLTLLDASASQRINEGDTVTVEATNGKTYTVKLDYVEEEGTADGEEADANFIVNDEAIDALEPGDSEEVEDGVYIVVDKVDYIDSDRRTSYAQFSLGTGKLLLEDGSEVELNDKAMSAASDEYDKYEVTTDLTYSSGDLSEITLIWKAADDVWLAPGSELLFPGFGGVKLTMGEFVQSDNPEEITLDNDGDSLNLNAEIASGDIDLPIVYRLGDNDAINGTGAAADEVLAVTAGAATYRNVSLATATDTMFVATYISGDEGETYAFQLNDIDYDSSTGETAVTLNNLVTGGKDAEFDDVADTSEFGEVELYLAAANETLGTATVTIRPTGSSSNTIYNDRVVTKTGLTILLPYTGAAADAGRAINLTDASDGTHYVQFVEEDEDEDLQVGGSFNISIAGTADDGLYAGATIQGSSYKSIEDDSDISEAYVPSLIATKIVLTDPDSGVNTIEVMYPGEESYAEVMVAESGATIGGGSSGNIVPIYDTDTIPTDKNLLVVGGSCVNTLAATLLGLPANSCGNAWQTKTNVGTGQFLIQTFARDGGKVATLVAGYNAEDTANAVNALKTDTTVEIAANKKFVGTATSVQAVNVA